MGLFVWTNEPSKIFVGDTPISKVFLWDIQVRPSGWTYSYDFTTWSVADFSSQWWSVPGSIVIDSNGMTANSSWATPSFNNIPWLNTALQTAKKIHYEFTYTQSGTRDFQHWLNVTNSNSNLELNLYGDWRWVEIVVWETTYVSGNKTAVTPWTYTRQFDVDLANKTLEYSIDGWTTWSDTITDTDITNLKTWINLGLVCSYNGYIKDFSITIE